MTYIVEKPAVSFAGIERPLITIEFAPKIHPSETEYNYEHPHFTFGDRVTISGTSFHYPPVVFTVCALELVESKTPSGRLLNQPYWMYKVTDGQENYWRDESALIRYTEKTCSTCSHFNNYSEPSGKGWCNLFDHQAREHHEITSDCINSSESVISHELQDNLALFPDVNFEELQAFPTEEIIDEVDKPHAEYKVGSIVKIIDKDKDYTEWATFEVIECMHNQNLYNSTETYLHKSEWYYRLSSTIRRCEATANPRSGLSSHVDGNTLPLANWASDKSLWIAENEICDFDMAQNICAEEVF